MAEVNEFGLVDLSILRGARRKNLRGRLAQLQNQTRGAEFAAGVAGIGIGEALANALASKGLVEDAELSQAQEITSAQKRARAANAATPTELLPDDPIERQIMKRQVLIRELEASGLTAQADTVRQQIIGLKEKSLEFRKLSGDVERQEVGIEQDRENLKRHRAEAAGRGELAQLQNRLAGLDVTDPNQALFADQILNRIEKLTTITGTTEFDPGADKVTLRRAEQSLADNTKALDGFEIALESFNPEFQTLAGRVKNFGLSLADQAGLDLSPENKAMLANFTTQKRITSANLNAYIKAVTGAQMAVQEAERISLDVPKPDDGPEVYRAKLVAVIDFIRAANARTLWAVEARGDRDEFNRRWNSSIAPWLEKATNTRLAAEEQAQAGQADIRQRGREALARLRGGQG